MMLRSDLAEALHATSRRREFQIVRALAGAMPMPPVYWYDDEGTYLPYPAIVYGFVGGVTKALHWYQVFNAYSMIAMTLGTSYRVARNGKSHQDILLAWLLGVGYMLLEEMRGLIAKGA